MEDRCDEQTLQSEYDTLRLRKEELEDGVEDCSVTSGHPLFEAVKNEIIEGEGTDVDAEEMTYNVLHCRREELEEELLEVIDKIDEVKTKAKKLF